MFQLARKSTCSNALCILTNRVSQFYLDFPSLIKHSLASEASIRSKPSSPWVSLLCEEHWVDLSHPNNQQLFIVIP